MAFILIGEGNKPDCLSFLSLSLLTVDWRFDRINGEDRCSKEEARGGAAICLVSFGTIGLMILLL